MTLEEITIQQRANELVLRIGRMTDDELMSPIFFEALMNERRITMEDCAEDCDKMARIYERSQDLEDPLSEQWSRDGAFAKILFAMGEKIRARGKEKKS